MQSKFSFEAKKDREESNKDMDDLATYSRYRRNQDAKDTKGIIFDKRSPERKEAFRKAQFAGRNSNKQGNKLSAIDVARAMDATERHDRRHPQLKKAANESAWIVESLQ